MCLVEHLEMIKPIVSCATLLKENLKIFTNSNLVKKAREYILEFLLINHPLDCPICDQGGECDLQDQTLLFGSDKGRFYEMKKITINKECNFFIKLIMTRCIHCTRCIRFLRDLNNNHELGMLGRGSNMEIGNYINLNINNEFVSNIADLCPVGALTLKFSEFKNRVWELVSVKFFDILDSTASTLALFLNGEKIVRILPYNNKFINNQWITDRSRYLLDSFYNNRLDNVYSFSKKKNKFLLSSWYYVYKYLFFFNKNLLKKNKVNILLNFNYLSLDNLLLFKNFNSFYFYFSNFNLNALEKFNNDFRNYIIYNNNNNSSFFSFQKILNKKSLILYDNYNVRLFNPLINLNIIKNYKYNKYLYIFNILFFFYKNKILNNLNFFNFFNLNFLKKKTFLNLFFSKLKKKKYFFFLLTHYKNYKNLNYYLLNFKFWQFFSYFLFENLFELNLFELNFNSFYFKNHFTSLTLNKKTKNLNIIFEENINLNYYYYYNLILYFLFNFYIGSYFLNLNNLNSFKIFDFLLPLTIFIEENQNTFNIFGLYQKSFKIKNWYKFSKNLNYLFKFFFFFLVINFFYMKKKIFKNL